MVKRKKCSMCKFLKELDDFPPCKWGRYGRYNYCRECHKAYQLERNPNRAKIDEKVARRLGLRQQGLKVCTVCAQVCNTNDDFYDDPRHTDGKQSVCKSCWNVRLNANRLMKEYGLTPEDYVKLLESQLGLCAICKRPPKNNKFNIDHSHKTHKVRALLCVNCNTNLLPIIERFPDWVKAAFEYLENPPAFSVIGEHEVPETNQARRKWRGVRNAAKAFNVEEKE